MRASRPLDRVDQRRPAGRPYSIVGLIAGADVVTDPDMRRALDERAHAME